MKVNFKRFGCPSSTIIEKAIGIRFAEPHRTAGPHGPCWYPLPDEANQSEADYTRFFRIYDPMIDAANNPGTLSEIRVSSKAHVHDLDTATYKNTFADAPDIPAPAYLVQSTTYASVACQTAIGDGDGQVVVFEYSMDNIVDGDLTPVEEGGGTLMDDACHVSESAAKFFLNLR